jgi:predicted ABC-type ATPase
MPVINPDDIAAALPRRGDGSLDELRAGRQALRERQQMLDAGSSFAVETTMSGNNPLRFMSEASERGYMLTLVYVGIGSAALSIQRVRDRVAAGGHDVPIDAILRRYPDTMAKLATALVMVDRAYIIDNSQTRQRLLIKIEGGRVCNLAEDMPAWAMRAVPAHYRLQV